MNESIRLQFKGRERKLLFGIGPSRILCEHRKISVSEMHTLDINELVQDIIWAALVFECRLRNEEPDFNIMEVYQWINDMEQDTFQKIFEIFIKTRTVGRSIYDTYMEKLEKGSGKDGQIASPQAARNDSKASGDDAQKKT